MQNKAGISIFNSTWNMAYSVYLLRTSLNWLLSINEWYCGVETRMDFNMVWNSACFGFKDPGHSPRSLSKVCTLCQSNRIITKLALKGSCHIARCCGKENGVTFKPDTTNHGNIDTSNLWPNWNYLKQSLLLINPAISISSLSIFQITLVRIT